MFGCVVFRVVHRKGSNYNERWFFVLARIYGSELTTLLTVRLAHFACTRTEHNGDTIYGASPSM